MFMRGEIVKKKIIFSVFAVYYIGISGFKYKFN